ncbi:MAG: hypothetical protein KZQ70_15180, partial [gamma proteobacterium symbiont of Lucinoma myriamae]|nr:hypothetical protein [gamma proteobacterium symbiont of Lucinoma myriamae]
MSGLGMSMGKFRLFLTELWPFLMSKNWFSASNLSIYSRISFKLGMCIGIGNVWFGIVDGQILI